MLKGEIGEAHRDKTGGAFSASLSLNLFCQGDREPWEVSEQGRHMFISPSYKGLSGAGVENRLDR